MSKGMQTPWMEWVGQQYIQNIAPPPYGSQGFNEG